MEQATKMPAEKPRLMVVGLGGTILSQPHMDVSMSSIHGSEKKYILQPSANGLDQLVTTIKADIRNHFKNVNTYKHEELIDSAQATARLHIQQIVSEIRDSLKKDEADVYIVLYGTDTMADLMAALGNGIAPEELGEKALITTCSMRHQERDDTDAFRNFELALRLAVMEEVKGKIGLMFNDRFFPPRGIEKKQNAANFPFICRFYRMAKFETERPEELTSTDQSEKQEAWTSRWVFRDSRPWDSPRGQTDHVYRLAMGIHSYHLTSSTDYKLIKKQIEDNKATIMVAPGNGNVRMDSRNLNYLNKAIDGAAGPVVLIGDAMQTGEDILPEDPDFGDETVYKGDASFLKKVISGGAMSETEARIFVSELIAECKHRRYTKEKTWEFVSDEIQKYPFRELKNSKDLE